jgi:hypothetical protein
VYIKVKCMIIKEEPKTKKKKKNALEKIKLESTQVGCNP